MVKGQQGTVPEAALQSYPKSPSHLTLRGIPGSRNRPWVLSHAVPLLAIGTAKGQQPVDPSNSQTVKTLRDTNPTLKGQKVSLGVIWPPKGHFGLVLASLG